MSFLDLIWQRLESVSERPVVAELRPEAGAEVTGPALLTQIDSARWFLRRSGVRANDRCALVAPNSIQWVAFNLAIIAEGAIAVPFYSRQSAAELARMMRDCTPSLVICGDPALAEAVQREWPEAPTALLAQSFQSPEYKLGEPVALRPAEPVTIIYTSGTSGEPKGVMLTAENVGFMLERTSKRLDQLMETYPRPDGDLRKDFDDIFHYLPFSFAGSWIMLLTSLLRGSRLAINSELNRIGDDLQTVQPDYFLNVPVLLERMRKAAEQGIDKRGGTTLKLYGNGVSAWARREKRESASGSDWLWRTLAQTFVFPAIRKKLAPGTRALICGSAPLAVDTQLWFNMLGLPVLQVYGLTETTAICTLDEPGRVAPGRVGSAIDGIEMRLGHSDEILVRGPNIFPGYWQRPEETAKVLREGWFHTGDQGEVDAAGNWRIIGRVKNLLVLASGHNVAPEPLEEKLERCLPGAQVMLIGHGRPYLSAIITGDVAEADVRGALDELNAAAPHYKRVHAFFISREPFTVDNGLLTANGKLKRDTITIRYGQEIDGLYQRPLVARG